MLKKPDSCQGCPMFGNGFGFVPDEIIETATTFILGQNPGQVEEEEGKPFVGPTGEQMMGEFFPRAGLLRGENVSIGNTLRCRLGRTNNLPKGKELAQSIQHCTAAHLRIPDSVRLVVAQGAVAWQATGNDTRISDWRGFLAPNSFDRRPVLGVLHLADLFRDPKMRIPSHRDWAKIRSYLEGSWPSTIPARIEGTPSNWYAVTDWFADALNAPYFVCDTEYDKDSKKLSLVGLGYPGMRHGLQIVWPRLPSWAKDSFVESFKRLVGSVTMVSQNSIGAELPILQKNCGINYKDYARIDDTMLAHAVLWAEWPHDLGFLASVYGVYPKMKHLASTDMKLYNWGDVIETISIWEGLKRELDADPESKAIYERQSLRLIPLLLKAHERGIRVNAARVGPAARDYTAKREAAQRLAWAFCGYPINVGSDDQLKFFLYTIEGMPVQRDKHSKKATTGTDAIAVLRGRIHPVPDFESEKRDGLSYDDALGRVREGAHPLLEARVIYAAAQQAYSHYIAPLILDSTGGSLDGEVVGGSHMRSVVRSRVYPEFHIHAQANARWSTVNGDSCKGGCDDPLHKVGLPMAQLPDDLRDIVYPDEGCVWYGWDFDQGELRINAALCNDIPTIKAFDNGWDIHTLNCCDCLGYSYPPQLRKPYDAEENEKWRQSLNWRRGDKDDPRRVFAKRFVYRLDYGGDPENAGDIPGAKALGLDSRALVQASNRYLAAHPNKAKWRQEAAIYLATTKEIPIAKTFMGRKRKLLSGGKARLREYFDYPMQGSVSDIKNTVLLDIYDALPELEFMYEMHDSAWEQGRATDCQDTGDVWKVLKPLIEREWVVNGVKMMFPATLKQQCTVHRNCFKREMR